MTDDNVTRFPSKPIDPETPIYGVEFVGPWEPEWRITVDGYRVPRLTAIVRQDGDIMLCLDGRFGIDGSREEVSKWLPIIAHAMAIGAGYSCHGENSKIPNPYKLGMIGLGGIPE